MSWYVMKRTSIKQAILIYLEGRDYVSGSEIENMSAQWLTKASTVSRRARELYEGGQLDRKLVRGCVWYKKRPIIARTSLAKSVDPTNPLEAIQLFETAPPRFNANPLTKKAK